MGLLPTTRRAWSPCWRRPVGCSKRRYQGRYVWGFVHPASGRTEWLITSTVSTAGMSAALQEFASEVGAGADRRIALVIDGAGWHSAPDVVVPEGVHLIFQPPYSPDVQPSEQLWPLLHEPLANRDFVDMNEHAAVTSARCKELSAQPDVVRGRTLFHWWPEDRAPRAERAAS